MQNLRLQLGRALAFVDGAPDVTGLPCDKISSAEAGDYMRRYHLENTPGRAIRFHHILASDPGDLMHDHPWDFVSVMLDGAYTEITPSGAVRYEAPCVITRKAEQLHRLVLEDPVWTYIVCGRVRRRWGFATPGGWVPWQRHPGRAALVGCEPRTRRLRPRTAPREMSVAAVTISRNPSDREVSVPSSDPEKIRAQKRAWRKKNPEAGRAENRAYRERNREKELARHRAYYERNPEKRRAESRAWTQENLEKKRAYNRAYYALNREQERARHAAEYRRQDPEKRRAKDAAWRHGTDTAVLIATLLAAQAGACYLCGEPLDPANMAIDHDHTCPHPRCQSCAYCRRGLACHRCNLLIGKAGDDPDLLRRIAGNLEKVLGPTRDRIAAKPQQLPLAM